MVAMGPVLLLLLLLLSVVEEGGHLGDGGAHGEGLSIDDLFLTQQGGRHVGVLKGDEGEGAEGTRHKNVGDLCWEEEEK